MNSTNFLMGKSSREQIQNLAHKIKTDPVSRINFLWEASLTEMFDCKDRDKGSDSYLPGYGLGRSHFSAVKKINDTVKIWLKKGMTPYEIRPQNGYSGPIKVKK